MPKRKMWQLCEEIIKDFGNTKNEQYYDKDTVAIFTALNSPDGIYKLNISLFDRIKRLDNVFVVNNENITKMNTKMDKSVKILQNQIVF